MSKYTVQITDPAERDLANIGIYISKELLEPGIALKVIDKIGKIILKLEDMPFRGSLVRDETLAHFGIRKIMIDSYIIFYTISEEFQTVTVVRILYAKRNWIDLL